MEQIGSFVELVEKSIKEFWDLDSLTDYEGCTLQYKDVARKIEKLHIMFENAGIKEGDKIALCGRNSANWGVAFMATLTYGAVAVPILHEFKSEQVHDIVNHSEAKLLFAGDQTWNGLSADAMPNLEGIINIPDYSLLVSRTEKLTESREHLNEIFGKKYPKYFRPEHVKYRIEKSPDELALINYTSGTTSNSKGVMIPYRALWSNLMFAKEVLGKRVVASSKVISILPMAHMYGMMFEFIFEFCSGSHVYYLSRIPSPKIIFKAFSEIKPSIVIAVPLIIEKIIRKAVLPKLQTYSMKLLLKVPVISQKIRDKINDALITAFGGNVYEIIVGGAAFNSEIEEFLTKIGFPITVGYGTTECSPIIAYSDWKVFKPGSCGKAAPRMEIKIENPNSEGVGEILTKGTNVMLGYYKNEEATKAVLDTEGWYRTGDLGFLDEDGNLSIRGRCKNMLLGASGQNIYPEEIEDKLNTLPYVSESIVIQKGEKLYGLIYPDFDEAKKDGLEPEQLLRQMDQNRLDLNAILPNYEQLAGIRIYKEEFEKTPKRSIKRFKYENASI